MPTALTFQEFVEKSKTIHGEKFEYDESSYQGRNCDTQIFCKKHKIWFKQKPCKHLIGRGCPICRYENSAKHKAHTPQEWEQKAAEIHHGKYKYYGDYTNGHVKVRIFCPVLDENGQPHGDFWMIPINHTHKTLPQGCPKCGLIKCANSRKSNILAFIKKAQIVHGNKFDYSKAKYVDNNTKLEIVCSKHGSFWQTPGNHLQGQGCPLCKESKLEKIVRYYLNKNNIQYVEQQRFPQILPNNWSVDFFLPQKNIAIECQGIQHFENNQWGEKNGKTFQELQSRDNEKRILLEQNGITTLYFSNLHIDYPYHVHETEESLIRSINEKENVDIVKQSSIHSTELFNFIHKLIPLETIEKNNQSIIFNDCVSVVLHDSKIIFDIIDLNTSHELFREYTFHNKRLIKAQQKGYRLIQIFEDEWLHKRSIVESRIKSILGIYDRRIYARQCKIQELSSKECAQFLNQNHIQGKCNTTIKYGLFYNTELVSVMAFCKSRHFIGKQNYEYEMIRFANKQGTLIVGGASKLLKHFIREEKPKSIITYADKRWSQGHLYHELGFEYLNDSQTNYFYVINGERKYRYNFRKSVLISQGFDKDKSEHEIMLGRKIYRIYDCGALSFGLNINTDA